MKKMMTMVMMMTIAISATAMTYNTARNEALFLTDKMAYELGLTTEQYNAVYEINLDYLLNVDTRADVYGPWWDVRNRDLRYVLSTWQYDRYIACEYFYRPVAWSAGSWTFAIYTHYGHGRMFYGHPTVYVNYRGGHSHRGGSFYSGHNFNKPNPPKGHNPSVGHGNHGNPPKGHGNGNHNGNWSHNGNGNHYGNPNHNGNGNHNGNPNHNGNGNHNGNHSPSMGNGNGSNHGSSAGAPSRSFGSRPSNNMASNGSNAPKRQFGGTRK